MLSDYDLMRVLYMPPQSPMTQSRAEDIQVAQRRSARSFKFLRSFKFTLLDAERMAHIRTRGIRVIPSQGHRCGFECEGLESTVERGLWVCLQSGLTHICGSGFCNLRNNGELDFCPLSGQLFHEALDYDDLRFSGCYNNNTHDGGGDETDRAIAAITTSATKRRKVEAATPPLPPPSPRRSDEDIRRQSFNHRDAQLFFNARDVVQRLLFSQKRQELDEANIQKVYAGLGEHYRQYLLLKTKAGKPPDERETTAIFVEHIKKARKSGGNVKLCNPFTPKETHELVTFLAQQSVRHWNVFVGRDLYSRGRSDSSTENWKPEFRSHTLAMIYAMKDGIYDPKHKERWLPRVPGLALLLPNERNLELLGFEQPQGFFDDSLQQRYKIVRVATPITKARLLEAIKRPLLRHQVYLAQSADDAKATPERFAFVIETASYHRLPPERTKAAAAVFSRPLTEDRKNKGLVEVKIEGNMTLPSADAYKLMGDIVCRPSIRFRVLDGRDQMADRLTNRVVGKRVRGTLLPSHINELLGNVVHRLGVQNPMFYHDNRAFVMSLVKNVKTLNNPDFLAGMLSWFAFSCPDSVVQHLKFAPLPSDGANDDGTVMKAFMEAAKPAFVKLLP